MNWNYSDPPPQQDEDDAWLEQRCKEEEQRWVEAMEAQHGLDHGARWQPWKRLKRWWRLQQNEPTGKSG
jgi:hypothetical protein